MAVLFERPAMSKGSQVTTTLTRSGLLTIDKVINDEYFSNTDKWKEVSLHWEGVGTENSQNKTLTFNGMATSDQKILRVSAKARANFNISVIVITDFDQGRLTINRDEIPSSLLTELDITYNA